MTGTPASLPPGPRDPAQPDDLYASPPPWDIGRPQQAFAALAASGEFRGRVLDAGCGTGEHALMCAGLGLDTTGIDLAGVALESARAKARDRDRTVLFLRRDARRLAELGETFDTVLDCGLFHMFSDEDRAAYAGGLRSVVGPGGRYFLLCFSDLQPGDWGPRRITQDEIRAAFAGGWRVDTIEPATLEVTISPEGVRAWLAAITRT